MPTLSVAEAQARLIWLLETTLRMGVPGAVGGCVSVPVDAARKPATTAPQGSELERTPVAETDPALDKIWSSTASLVFGSAGTLSSIVQSLPTVNVSASAVDNAPITRSPAVDSV